MRKIDSCMNCGEERELVAHGLCARCYMAGRRETERRDDPYRLIPERSQRRYVAERNRNLINLTKIVKLVDETTCLSPDHMTAIKMVVQPYILERAVDLAPLKKTGPQLTENSESPLTVSSPDEVNEGNSESELTINSEPSEEESFAAVNAVEPPDI
jgi:hypothetical protein